MSDKDKPAGPAADFEELAKWYAAQGKRPVSDVRAEAYHRASVIAPSARGLTLSDEATAMLDQIGIAR